MIRSAIAGILALSLVAPLPADAVGGSSADALHLPWREAGWTEREAAAHLLDRLAFGARPGDIEAVARLGLDQWAALQIQGVLPEPQLAGRLESLPAWRMTSAEIGRTYPPGFAIRTMAIDAGVVDREELESAQASPDGRRGREARKRVYEWMQSEGYRPERELLAQSHAAKLLRAVYAENQLHEVLADFWFNHFNVSLSDVPVRQYLLTYERDAIRPFVTGRFADLLEATAKHPAMLLYLDNFRSVADEGQVTTFARQVGRTGRRGGFGAGEGRPSNMTGVGRRGAPGMSPDELAKRLERRRADNPNRPKGLNENYARELLELHTLGVDGGYSQEDVVEVARAFTGWALLPPGRLGETGRSGLEQVKRAGGLGFVRQGDFVFRADAHDAGEKLVLGIRLPAGRGLEDGEQVLGLLAAHPSTARHLATKLAARFVTDSPPESLIERLAEVYSKTGGDLGKTMRALVESREFWSREARGAKVKSPFEVAVSALRALDAELANPFPVIDWIARMGQPLYAFQAPSGFPDGADHWVNTGALLARMNFGLELAAGRVPGIEFDLEALIDRREPESAEAALETYARALLPERDTAATVAQLVPLLVDPEVARRIAERAPESGAATFDSMDLFEDTEGMRAPDGSGSGRGAGRDVSRLPGLAALFAPAEPMARADEPPSVVAGVAGLILGSPEFQRR